MTTDEWIEGVKDRLAKATPPDCGDNSCYFAAKKDGMRTNGGCRCYKNCTTEARHYTNQMLRTLPTDLARAVEEIEGLRKQLDDNAQTSSENISRLQFKITRIQKQNEVLVAEMRWIGGHCDCTGQGNCGHGPVLAIRACKAIRRADEIGKEVK